MDGSVKTGKEQKHITIVGAISGLEFRMNSLEDLIRVIGGTPPEDRSKPIETNPCLREFLDRASGELNVLSDRLVKATEELSALLF